MPGMRGYAPVATSSSPSEQEKPRSGPSGLLSSILLQRSRRPLAFALAISASAVFLVAWLAHGSLPSIWPSRDAIDADGDAWPFVDQVQREKKLRRLSWGALKEQGAKSSIRANLKDDRAYLFTIYGAGWNNQVFQAMNLIYLAHLSDRIPILSSFRWNSFHGQSGDAAVSEIFDLSQLSSSLDNVPLVEMHEVKGTTTQPERLLWVEYDGETVQYKQDGGERWQVGELMHAQEMQREDVGCWSMHGSKGKISPEGGPELYMIDTPYTPVPRSCYRWDDDPGRPSFLRVADILRHRQPPSEWPPAGSLEIMKNYSIAEPKVWPDTHLACIDSTFGFVEQLRHDVGAEYRAGTGAWAVVGSKMRFSAGIEKLGRMYLGEVFGLRNGEEVPPYIAVHIRRGDFGQPFLDLDQRQYAHAAWQVKETLRIKHGVEVKHVLATSDEDDPSWIGKLEEFGFTFVNHTRLETVERLGQWFPTVLDSYMLSMGKGFLGVIYSTMSILAYRRTIDWNQGVARMIELDHSVPQDWVWT